MSDGDGAFVKGPPADHAADDDLVPGSQGLPEDVAEEDLGPDEVPEAVELPADDLDAPAIGEPFAGEVPFA